jgi:pyruvate dehydrogenase E2 component (dihydrolipoamide acetyltransferase)
MEVRLPNLGEGADAGVVVNVLVKAGDSVQVDQPILELETEKAVGTIPSSAAGTVEQVRVKVGDKIAAGQVILTLSGAKADSQSPIANRQPARPVAAPSVRRLARELGVDLAKVTGAEPGGRITMEDVRAQARPAVKPVDFAQWGPVERQPLSPLRQTIARRLTESWTSTPRVTQFDEADITALNELRKGRHLTLTVFAVRAAVAALRQHPEFNASLDEAAGELVLKRYYHIGVAVDTEHGLMVPVIRDADRKSPREISQELETLAAKARTRKLAAEEMRGGSFTISNQGGIGSGAFTPIINKPEVAILGLGRGALKPVVRDGQVVVRLMMPVALSYDHRVIDGGNAARFVMDFVKGMDGTDQG